MNAMLRFPTWAPERLIDEFKQLKAHANSFKEIEEEVKEANAAGEYLVPFLEQTDWEKEANETDKLAEILLKLLTNPDMETAWRVLSRTGITPKHFEVDTAISAFMLWDCISRAHRDFPGIISIARTPSERVKKLQSAIRKAESLIDEIYSDQTITKYSNGLVGRHLSIQNILYRGTIGDTPSRAELLFNIFVPFALKADCSDVAKSVMENIEFEDKNKGCRWREIPLVERLGFWASSAQDINLSVLLQLFVDLLKNEAEIDQEIKQPGRGDTAFRAFLIRRISDYMMWCYGQPLDDVVARIISIILDIPLTRDDIRPYVSGKKNRDNS